MIEGLDFEDVTIIPKYSDISSRKKIDVSTFLTKDLKLKIPLISSNMDTVTDWRMSVEMARLGGIGFIHRYMSVEEEVRQVSLIKRKRNIIITEPLMVDSSKNLSQAKILMASFNVSGLLVVDNGVLKGVLSRRDYEGRGEDIGINELMTPLKDLVIASPSISLDDAKQVLLKNKIEKLPLVDGNGFVKGLITLKDLFSLNGEVSSVDDKGRFLVGGSVGVKENDYTRAERIVEAGVDLIVVDVAHGHNKLCLDMVKGLRKRFGSNVRIVAGNVCTKNGVQDLVSAGADCVKVGVGPGHACITRVVTGAGVPQISAIMSAKDCGVPVISDGGIKDSGDLAKAIGAGASTVMIGTLFAGTDEAPGDFIMRNNKRVKLIRGMASTTANKERDGSKIEAGDYVPEGVESFVEMKGPVKGVVHQLIGGLKSGMSYSGAKDINEFWNKCEFMKVTPSFKERAGSFGLGV